MTTTDPHKSIKKLFGVLFLFIVSSPAVMAYDGSQAMPLPFFILFLCLGILLTILGFIMGGSVKYLGVVGTVILFLMGAVIEDGRIGISTTTTINSSEVVQQYEGYSDNNTHLFGYLLMIISVILFVTLLVGGEDEI